MSATIYTNGAGDKGAIIDARNGYQRQFNAGNWFDLTIGCVGAITDLSTDSSATIDAESLETTHPSNILHFGLTENTISELPGDVGSNFLGIRSLADSDVILAGMQEYIENLLYSKIANGVLVEGDNIGNLPIRWGTSSPLYFYWAVRFIRIVTTQEVRMIFASGTTTSATVATLRTLMEAVPNTGGDVLAHVDDLNTLLIYWPFNNTRLKLHCVGVIKAG